MPLITAPFFSLNSMYRPNRFLLSMTSPYTLVSAKAKVFVNGVTSSTISKPVSYNIGSTYYFEFDVAKLLQLFSAPKAQNKTSVFPDALNQPYNVQNSDCHTYDGLIVVYYYNDPTTGLLTAFGTVDTIPFGNYAHIGTRQNKDYLSMGMDGYILDPILGGKPFLTNRPNPYFICPNENLFLSFIPYLSNAMQVQTFDANGVVIDLGLADITPNVTYIPTTVGVGMTNLASQIYFQGSVNINNPLAEYYLVTIGVAFPFGGGYLFLPTSLSHQYVIDNKCCEDKSTRLHWLNKLGGADAYTFRNRKKIQHKTKSVTAQKPLNWGYSLPPATPFDKGIFKIQQDSIKEYEVEGDFYTEEEGDWLSEILDSPEVYMETPYGLVSVVITDSSITTFENDELSNLKITFSEANNLSLQQN